MPAVSIYRESFRPSAVLSEPYVMLGVAALAADDEAEARRLSKPGDLAFLRLRAGRPGPFPTPEEAADFHPTPHEKDLIAELVGVAASWAHAEQVDASLRALVARTGADELMITTMVHDPQDRIRSYELIAAEVELPGSVSAHHR